MTTVVVVIHAVVVVDESEVAVEAVTVTRNLVKKRLMLFYAKKNQLKLSRQRMLKHAQWINLSCDRTSSRRQVYQSVTLC